MDAIFDFIVTSVQKLGADQSVIDMMNKAFDFLAKYISTEQIMDALKAVFNFLKENLT